jgi:hypothetical protein
MQCWGEQDTGFRWREIEPRLRSMGLPDFNLSIWLKLAGIYEILRFSRVWVIQEFLVAKRPEFWCGKHIISQECLLNVASISIVFGRPRSPPTQTIHEAKRFGCFNAIYLRRTRLEMSSSPMALQDLLTSNHDVTNPKDRIFALVSLSTDFAVTFINYELSLDEVIFSFAKKALLSKGPSPFDLLVRVEPSESGCYHRGSPSSIKLHLA